MVPMMMKAQMTPTWNDLDNRRSRWLTVMARLKPGVSRAAGRGGDERDLPADQRAGDQGHPERVRDRSGSGSSSKHLDVLPGQQGLSDLRSEFSTPLIVLMSMVGVVLLIACANVANLLLARDDRAAEGDRRCGSRSAPSRARIVRQQLVESALLAVGGRGASASLLAWWTGSLLLAALPGDPAARNAVGRCPICASSLFALGGRRC